MVRLTIKAVPQSGRQAFAEDAAGRLKCFLKSPPVDGKANKELIEFLAKTLKVPKGAVMLVSGLSSRTKIVEIACRATPTEIFDILVPDRQLTIMSGVQKIGEKSNKSK